MGIATTAPLRAGIPVVSQRDDHPLGRLRARLDPTFTEDPDARDHHERNGYRNQFE